MFLDQLFDSLNVNSKVAPTTKPLKGGVTEFSMHEDYWRMAVKVIKSMKFLNKEKKSFVKVPTLKNLVHTLEGFIYLKKFLVTKFNFKYILTRFFNQDPLENFCSYLRSHGVRNVSPGPTHFTSSFKTLLVNNFMTYHSPFSNCEGQASKTLTNLKSFLTDNGDKVGSSTLCEPIPNIDCSIIPLAKMPKLARCSITYYAGYVAKKISKIIVKHNCDICTGNLIAWGNNRDTDFIEAREYKPDLLIRPGGFLTFIVSRAVPYLNYLIPRLCQKTQLPILLKHLLVKKIDFKPINCKKHQLANHIISLLIRCAVYFWCKKVNKICRGLDLKFMRYVKKCTNINSIDPIKLKCLKK